MGARAGLDDNTILTNSTAMVCTVELRWFFAGRLPQSAVGWFRAFGTNEQQPPRTDRYLRPSDAAMNVKLREGRVEAKRRMAAPHYVVLGGSHGGQMAQWCKWSFALAEPPGDLDDNWVPVRKTRWLLRYAWTDGMLEVTRDADLEPRCEVELSEVEVLGRPWWSLCCEASGDEADVLTSFALQTARHLADSNPPHTLKPEASYGYPAWLLRLPV